MLGDLLANSIATVVPPLDARKAVGEAVPAVTIRFVKEARFWLQTNVSRLPLGYDAVIRRIIGEVMTEHKDSELQRLLREAASEPIPRFDPEADDGKTHALTIRMSAAERHWVEHRSAALNMPSSVLVCFLVQQYAKADMDSNKGADF